MKKILFITINSLLCFNAFGQSSELNVVLSSGLFSYYGKSTTSISSIEKYSFNQGIDGYTYNPYGNLYGMCYGVAINFKEIKKNNLILGLDLGYENARSRVMIDKYFNQNANGNTYLISNFLNPFPHVGYRKSIRKINIDIVAGADVAYCIANRINRVMIENNKQFVTIESECRKIEFDVRPRFQIESSYKKCGVFLGTSIGIINYLEKVSSANLQAYSRLFRFGLNLI